MPLAFMRALICSRRASRYLQAYTHTRYTIDPLLCGIYVCRYVYSIMVHVSIHVYTYEVCTHIRTYIRTYVCVTTTFIHMYVVMKC